MRRARGIGHNHWTLSADDAERLAAARQTEDGPRILIATSTGLHFGASRMDQVLAVALTMRGAKVDVLLCDEALPACMIGDHRWFPRAGRYAETGPKQDFCSACFGPANEAWTELGFKPLKLGEQLSDDDRAAAKRWADDVMHAPSLLKKDPIAAHALAGALRFFARATLPPGPDGKAVLRSFLIAARLANLAAGNLMDAKGYAAVVLHHGIYVPQGSMLEAARRRSRRVIAWNAGYRIGCFLFSHDDTYHRTMITEPTERWSDLALTPEWQETLSAYLESRRHGGDDWIVFNRANEFSANGYLRERGIDPERPVVLAMTNVAWDAQLHYPDNCFRSMEEWLNETVAWFTTRADMQLVVRIHPGEVTGAPRASETAIEMLLRRFAELPANILVVSPTERISSYALMEASDAVIIYATKAGIEATAMGKPVVVGGEAWVRGKAIALDATNPDHYREVLAGLTNLPPRSQADIERARRYAFHFFFRRMIPVGTARRMPGWPPFAFDTSSLGPYEAGADPGLDVICDGIINGAPFEFPAERFRPDDVIPARRQA